MEKFSFTCRSQYRGLAYDQIYYTNFKIFRTESITKFQLWSPRMEQEAKISETRICKSF